MTKVIFAPSKLARDFQLQGAVEKRHSPASVEVQSFMDFERGQEENHL